jgi:hypothetical protein
MFKTAGVRFVRSVFYSISIASLAGLLGACTHSSPPDPGGPKSWVVENVASKTTEELYRDLIKPGVFERSSSKVIDGYTVESGNLRMPDKSVGALVTVRSTDGSLTAHIEQPEKSGLLTISKRGEARFSPHPRQDYSLPDTVIEKQITAPVNSKSPLSTVPYVIDMFIGYSRHNADWVGGDVLAHALGMVEGLNLALRNSLITNVSMRLVGTQIVEQNYPMVPETLSRLKNIFAAGVAATDPDMVYGGFGGYPGDAVGGYGYMPGNLAIGYPILETFRHEVGHNVGGLHCKEDGEGAPYPYGYGYRNGKTSTSQCGGDPYYSNPAVRDAYGLPIGNLATADMARVWRENSERLSSYSPPFVGERMSFASLKGSSESILEIRMPARYQAGIVALNSTEGPTTLAPAPKGYTRLTVKLKNDAGDEREVYLRAERFIGGCELFAMNAYAACPFSGSESNKLNFKLRYSADDNPTLPASVYNGVLRLEARNLLGSWKTPVVVLMSIAGGR